MSSSTNNTLAVNNNKAGVNNNSAVVEIPQWKKDLIARLRSQNRRQQQLDDAERVSAAPPSPSSPPLLSIVPSSSSSDAVGHATVHTTSAATAKAPSSTVVSVACRQSSEVPSPSNNSERGDNIAVGRVCDQKTASSKLANAGKMVQDRAWAWDNLEQPAHEDNNGDCAYSKHSDDSDSSEDLHYGPGIVNKLRNKYLSLALRETSSRNHVGRASILPMRKAASLENILADEDDNELSDDDDHHRNKHQQTSEGVNHRHGHRLFQRTDDTTTGFNKRNASSTTTNRYYFHHRIAASSEMKRARSVETISRSHSHPEDLLMHNNQQNDQDQDDIFAVKPSKPKRESLHEEMLISSDTKSGSHAGKITSPVDDKMLLVVENHESGHKPSTVVYTQRINRPKRITPVMNEREKPPADFVKQTKMIFERRPEQRTKQPPHTGEVAAKVATYKNIIVQAKVQSICKKPPIKHKPTNLGVDGKKSKHVASLRNTKKPTKDLVADNMSNHEERPAKTTEINSLPSPIPDISRVDFSSLENDRGSRNTSLSETPDLIMTSSPLSQVSSPAFRITATENFIEEERRHSMTDNDNKSVHQSLSPIKTQANLDKNVTSNGDNTTTASSVTYNFVKTNKSQTHLPSTFNNQNHQNRFMEPLKLDVNGISNNVTSRKSPVLSLSPSSSRKSPPISPLSLSPASKKSSPRSSPMLVQETLLPTSPSRNSPDSSNKPIVQETPPGHQGIKEARLKSPPPSRTISPDQKSPSKFKHETGEVRLRSPPPPPRTASPEHQKSVKLSQREPNRVKLVSPPLKTGATSSSKSGLTIAELEKNLINAAKTLEQPPKSHDVPRKSTGTSEEAVIKNVVQAVPKVKRPSREPENNSIVFKFTDRKDVPDYVHNDGLKRVGRIEKPKVGEGGIILLPGASIGESFTDDDEEEIMRSLEGPPSPCDVTFLNDNILIDGKSSLNQKTKKPKMSISFLESGPEVYEYPSETSLIIIDEAANTSSISNSSTSNSSNSSAQMGHTVPSLAGTSSLANYTPKSTEEFQPGITRSAITNQSEKSNDTVDTNNDSSSGVDGEIQEFEEPILFSAGTNSDILF